MRALSSQYREKQVLTVHSSCCWPGDTAWSICNSHGISLAELHAANKHVDVDQLQPGQVVRVPVVLGLEHFQHSSSSAQQQSRGPLEGLGRLFSGSSPGSGQQQQTSSSGNTSNGSSIASSSASLAGGSISDSEEGSSSSSSEWLEPGTSLFAGGGQLGKGANLFQLVTSSSSSQSNALLLGSQSASSDIVGPSEPSSLQFGLPGVHSPAAAAVAHAAASGNIPDGGLVAVKIQYPGALQTMTLDLVNLRATSAFLQKTELKFDLLSAVEELQRQIHLEFDFMR